MACPTSAARWGSACEAAQHTRRGPWHAGAAWRGTSRTPTHCAGCAAQVRRTQIHPERVQGKWRGVCGGDLPPGSLVWWGSRGRPLVPDWALGASSGQAGVGPAPGMQLELQQRSQQSRAIAPAGSAARAKHGAGAVGGWAKAPSPTCGGPPRPRRAATRRAAPCCTALRRSPSMWSARS